MSLKKSEIINLMPNFMDVANETVTQGKQEFPCPLSRTERMFVLALMQAIWDSLMQVIKRSVKLGVIFPIQTYSDYGT